MISLKRGTGTLDFAIFNDALGNSGQDLLDLPKNVVDLDPSLVGVVDVDHVDVYVGGECEVIGRLPRFCRLVGGSRYLSSEP